MRRLAPGPEQVAVARERDRALALALIQEQVLRLVVGRRADGEAVSEPHEPPFALEEGGELAVLDGDRREARLGELGLQLLGRRGPLAEARLVAGEVEPRPAALDSRERENVARPGLGGNRDPRVERVGGLDPLLEVGAELLQPVS